MKTFSVKVLAPVLTFAATFAVVAAKLTVVAKACAAGLGETEVPDVLK